MTDNKLENYQTAFDNHQYQQGLDYLFAAVNDGHLSASFELAELYSYGVEDYDQQGNLVCYLASDLDQEMKHLAFASQQGLAVASERLAQIFYDGRGDTIEKSSEKALEMYQLAHSQGSQQALMWMADILYHDIGDEPSQQQALSYYQTLQQDEPVARYRIACCYLTGHLLPKNLTKALTIFTDLVESSEYLEAAYHLAELYYHGEGVEQSYQAAFDYYLVAGEAGSKEAEYKFAVMQFSGIGIEQEKELAIEMLFSLAEESGHEKAKEFLLDRGFDLQALKAEHR